MTAQISRRRLLKGAAGAAAVGLTVSKASPTFAAPAVLQSTGSTVEVVFWSSFGSGQLGTEQKKLIDDYNSSQKDVKVNLQTQDNYEDTAGKLTAALQAGTPPDLATLSDVWWFRFYLSDSLVDLTSMVSAADKADYVTSLYNDYQWNKGQWGLPFARSTPLFYWNKDIFQKAGIDAPPKTWSDLAQMAPDLVKKGGARFALAYDNAANYVAWTNMPMVWAFGGHYSQGFTIELLKPGCQAAANYVLQSIKDGWAEGVASADSVFQAGQVATNISSTGSIGGFLQAAKFEMGTEFMPTEKQFGCCTGGTGISIIKNDKNPEKVQAAYKLVQHLTSPAITTEWSQSTGYLPVRKSAVDSASMQAFFKKNPNFETAVRQLPKTSPQDAVRVYVPQGDADLGAGWDDITANKVDPMKAFTTTKQQLEQAIQQEVFPLLKKRQGFLPGQGTPIALGNGPHPQPLAPS